MREYFLVVIANDKISAAITKELGVKDVEHLDMDGFRFAGQINLTAWINNDDRYIGFIRGRGDVSEYFKEFLGCETVAQDKRDTADLVEALFEFAVAQNMDLPKRETFLSKAKSICERASVARTELDFAAMANELAPEDPNPLLHHLADPDRTLTDGFVPHRGTLGSLVKFKAKTPLWAVEFDREALTSGKLKFDPKAKSLTITDLPPELIDQLKAETTVNAKH